jgi:hypothetical protein
MTYDTNYCTKATSLVHAIAPQCMAIRSVATFEDVISVNTLRSLLVTSPAGFIVNRNYVRFRPTT